MIPLPIHDLAVGLLIVLLAVLLTDALDGLRAAFAGTLEDGGEQGGDFDHGEVNA